MPRRYPTLETFRAVHISTDCGSLYESDECCICLDPYNDSSHQAVGITSNSECDHVFGRRCLEAYLDSSNPGKNTCPVCRRKWYSRRPINPPTPRDINTPQVLAPPSQLRTFTQDVSEARVIRRGASGERIQPMGDDIMSPWAERLVETMGEIESLEAAAPALDQDVRIRLLQVQDRLRSFLGRNNASIETTASAAAQILPPRRVPRSAADRLSRHLSSSVIAELDNGEDPYSLLGAAMQSSTLSLPELAVPPARTPQPPVLSSVVAPRPPPTRRYPASPTRTSNSPRPPRAMSTSQGSTLRREVHIPQTHRLNMAPSRSISQLQPHIRSTTSSWDAESRLFAHANGGNADIERISYPRNGQARAVEVTDALRHDFFAGTAAYQGMSRSTNDLHPVRVNVEMIEWDQTLSPIYPSMHSDRTRHTQGFAYDSQPAGLAPQRILAASMAERSAGLRSRASPNTPRGLSRMLSISNLRGLVVRNRS